MTSPDLTGLSAYLADLNRTFENLHTAKEDAFWTAYMGLQEDAEAARADLSAKEIVLNEWLQNPEQLQEAEHWLNAANDSPAAVAPEDRLVLEGWVRTFQAHAIGEPAARQLAAEITEAEGRLANARGSMSLGYTLNGTFIPASSVKLAALASTDPDPVVRKAAWEGLASIEPHVLSNGFIEVLKMRNRLGRMLGGEDYYDWKVRRTEGLSKAEIFTWLDELEAKTRDAGRSAVESLVATHGADQVTGWNIRYLMSGDLNRELDPYFPFAQSLERWGRSFAALGIQYRNATLVLDLVDRKGKYENGFMHGPVPAWRENGNWRPARIQFTANAIPGMVGVGLRATETLFHEGGHAAHFANIDMPSPCFAQEFAPTSVAMAETQSMFLDSLLGDADWRTRYARTAAGDSIPFELLERTIQETQPYAAWGIRAMLAVCYGEKALYELPEDQLTPEHIMRTLREVEQRLLFIDASPRPILAVPHLLAGESSAYYHGYVLAEMAVQQTRHFFLKRDGHLTDNPKIGPDLQRHYWQAGNSRTFGDFVASLTGEPLTAQYLAAKANATVDECLAEARARIARLESIPPYQGTIDLGGSITVRHGNETIASTAAMPFEEAATKFAGWIEAQAAVTV